MASTDERSSTVDGFAIFGDRRGNQDLRDVGLHHEYTERLDEQGRLIESSETWRKAGPDGPLHREGAPASIEVRESDGTTIESYYRDGVLRRDDGPAVIHYYPDEFLAESYYADGKLHREDGPAETVRGPGDYYEDLYYRQGKLHRDDGPAVVRRNTDVPGAERHGDEWWRNGVEVDYKHYYDWQLPEDDPGLAFTGLRAER